jgi:glycosyltransferase involved in cell wall biosynthesis
MGAAAGSSRQRFGEEALSLTIRSGFGRDALPRDPRPDVRGLSSGAAPLIVYAFRRVRRRTSTDAFHEKGEFLGKAAALLFPIECPEPFGLVMIESLACGTPVIAFESGSAPEIVDNGLSGFLVGDVAEAALAVGRLSTLSRWKCREIFEQRFTANRMASDYLDIFRRLLSRHEGDGEGNSGRVDCAKLFTPSGCQ